MKATDLLKKDHAAVKKLFADFDKTGQRAVKKRRQLADKITTELEVHAAIEEEVFYPAMRRASGGQDLVEEAQREHAEVKQMVAEIRGLDPDDASLADRVAALKEAVEHHVREEEGEMFRRARELGDEELQRLGQALKERKQALTGGRRAARKAA
ncbi:MAG TPA: hemerythrin domain-containing protein [Candidatus Binatia bacterium]|nr:hemerythrin domain-containing protein [Candidatus Binatia bacterium]